MVDNPVEDCAEKCDIDGFFGVNGGTFSEFGDPLVRAEPAFAGDGCSNGCGFFLFDVFDTTSAVGLLTLEFCLILIHLTGRY